MMAKVEFRSAIILVPLHQGGLRVREPPSCWALTYNRVCNWFWREERQGLFHALSMRAERLRV